MTQLSQRLYTAEAVRQLDRAAIEGHGMPAWELMCRAGRALFEATRLAFPNRREWLVLCGAGNNAGDGYVVARLAREAGLEATVVALKDPAGLAGEAARAAGQWQAAGGEVQAWSGALPGQPELLVDALLGTGLDRAVSGDWYEAIEQANALECRRVAVDIPSGLHADTGVAMGVAVHADLTVTFIGRKRGLFTADGPDYCGRLLFDDLGTPADIHAEVAPESSSLAGQLLGIEHLQALPLRRRNSHKGLFGHLLVVGGNQGMSGAARLAGESALRSGAGLVTVATHAAHAGVLNLARPELMVQALDAKGSLAACLGRATVLAAGPGLGTDEWAQTLLTELLATDLPMVLDADGLNLLSRAPCARGNWVLTPHPAEAARLLGSHTREVQADRVGAAQNLARTFNAEVVLKGCGTVVASPDGRWAICPLGNPGMATAGAGDVLTGVIGGLLAQGLANGQAARLGVLAHAAAGDQAAQAGQRGLVALDICEALRAVVNPPDRRPG